MYRGKYPDERVQIFIDKSNLYHALLNKCKRSDLDYIKLVEELVNGRRLIRANLDMAIAVTDSTSFVGTHYAPGDSPQSRGRYCPVIFQARHGSKEATAAILTIYSMQECFQIICADRRCYLNPKGSIW